MRDVLSRDLRKSFVRFFREYKNSGVDCVGSNVGCGKDVLEVPESRGRGYGRTRGHSSHENWMKRCKSSQPPSSGEEKQSLIYCSKNFVSMLVTRLAFATYEGQDRSRIPITDA